MTIYDVIWGLVCAYIGWECRTFFLRSKENTIWEKRAIQLQKEIIEMQRKYLALIAKVREKEDEFEEDEEELYTEPDEDDENDLSGWHPPKSKMDEVHDMMDKMNEQQNKDKAEGINNGIQRNHPFYAESDLMPWEHAFIDKYEAEERKRKSKGGENLDYEEIK